jgi:hypothetical protein
MGMSGTTDGYGNRHRVSALMVSCLFLCMSGAAAHAAEMVVKKCERRGRHFLDAGRQAGLERDFGRQRLVHRGGRSLETRRQRQKRADVDA